MFAEWPDNDCTCGLLHSNVVTCCTWAARYNTWLLIKLTPKGVVFSFLVTCEFVHACVHIWVRIWIYIPRAVVFLASIHLHEQLALDVCGWMKWHHFKHAHLCIVWYMHISVEWQHQQSSSLTVNYQKQLQIRDWHELNLQHSLKFTWKILLQQFILNHVHTWIVHKLPLVMSTTINWPCWAWMARGRYMPTLLSLQGQLYH